MSKEIDVTPGTLRALAVVLEKSRLNTIRITIEGDTLDELKREAFKQADKAAIRKTRRYDWDSALKRLTGGSR